MRHSLNAIMKGRISWGVEPNSSIPSPQTNGQALKKPVMNCVTRRGIEPDSLATTNLLNGCYCLCTPVTPPTRPGFNYNYNCN